MQQTKEQQQEFNYKSPAFPPQVAQDNFGRIFAAIPGMSKLEYFAIQMYPLAKKMSFEKPFKSNGTIIKAEEISIIWAKQLLDQCNLSNQSIEHEPGNVITMDAK